MEEDRGWTDERGEWLYHVVDEFAGERTEVRAPNGLEAVRRITGHSDVVAIMDLKEPIVMVGLCTVWTPSVYAPDSSRQMQKIALRKTYEVRIGRCLYVMAKTYRDRPTRRYYFVRIMVGGYYVNEYFPFTGEGLVRATAFRDARLADQRARQREWATTHPRKYVRSRFRNAEAEDR